MKPTIKISQSERDSKALREKIKLRALLCLDIFNEQKEAVQACLAHPHPRCYDVTSKGMLYRVGPGQTYVRLTYLNDKAYFK